MNLDDYKTFKEIDREDMLTHIIGLPDQLQTAWDVGSRLPLPKWDSIDRVLIAGMGGSAIGADLLAAYVAPQSRVPVIVHRDYDLPAWASGPETLVIASSHSGNTEETLSAFEKATQRGCRILCASTGGQLAEAAKVHNVSLWKFDHKGQPRAAVGYSFSLLLAAFTRLGFIPDPVNELKEAILTMKKSQGWKGQISEIAKAWAQFEYLPEANHNTLAGIINPEENLSRTMVMFLRAQSNHPRNQLRTKLTRKIFMLQGIGTGTIDAQGETALTQLWTSLHLGDYIAYYLAMAYGVDPTPVEAIEGFKRDMITGA
jgi:glucose/mannose-6-phosphate isomerase